ncbi:MAG: hypothetical protein LBV69_09065 [Bacteroidales bacterium]|jgi:hypothetical protein|nr:hypothetical protein [Bacteroidales bacterium]
MKHLLTLFTIVIFSISATFAQSDFEKYAQEQKTAFNNYSTKEQKAFKNFNDSINREYAKYLEETWKSFNLQKKEVPIKKPITKPPVYDENSAKPQPQELPVVKPQPPTPQLVPKPKPPQEPEPNSKPEAPKENFINTSFFGTNIKLKSSAKQNLHLADVSEKAVADYWTALSNCQYVDWVNDAQRIKNEQKLNDWAVHQLLNTMFKTYFTNGNNNEQVIFNVFVFNQLGYKAKIGRSANNLYVMAAFKEEVYNTTYFIFNDNVRYYVINPLHTELSNIQTCSMNYGGATNYVVLYLSEQPVFSADNRTKNLTFNNKTYTINYNKNKVDFYDTYPLSYYTVYAEAPIDNITWQSVLLQIKPNVSGKSQEDAVNWLLHFVQNAFIYKTDQDNSGYEKWNFAEETFASDFSDCDDRAILFSQLVRHLLGMEVVLIYYPGVHLATAVKFSNPNTKGDYISVDGQNYLLCDPTYIGANLGMAMPQLRNVAVEVIKIK